MRQIADLAVWVGMIVIAVGVVYYTPILAEYFATESRPTLEAAAEPPRHQTVFRSSHSFEWPSPNH